ncbi:MAG: hypothetical protein GQE15_43280 [Archangiaceae bacterium]|nr:hypothetical protein [Archangiaceae bacterium]
MKSTLRLSLAFTVLVAGIALAFNPTLRNEDSKSYEMDIECGGSTTHTSISGNTSTTLSNVGCKLKVKGAGSAKLTENMKCVIKNSMLDCD